MSQTVEDMADTSDPEVEYDDSIADTMMVTDQETAPEAKSELLESYGGDGWTFSERVKPKGEAGYPRFRTGRSRQGPGTRNKDGSYNFDGADTITVVLRMGHKGHQFGVSMEQFRYGPARSGTTVLELAAGCWDKGPFTVRYHPHGHEYLISGRSATSIACDELLEEIGIDVEHHPGIQIHPHWVAPKDPGMGSATNLVLEVTVPIWDGKVYLPHRERDEKISSLRPFLWSEVESHIDDWVSKHKGTGMVDGVFSDYVAGIKAVKRQPEVYGLAPIDDSNKSSEELEELKRKKQEALDSITELFAHPIGEHPRWQREREKSQLKRAKAKAKAQGTGSDTEFAEQSNVSKTFTCPDPNDGTEWPPTEEVPAVSVPASLSHTSDT